MGAAFGVRGNRVIALALALAGSIGASRRVLDRRTDRCAGLSYGRMVIVYAFFATVVGGMGSLVELRRSFVVGFAQRVPASYLPVDMWPFRDAFLSES